MRTTVLARAMSAPPRAPRAAPWAENSLSSVRYSMVLRPSWASLSHWPLHHCPVGMAPPFVFTAPPWSLPFLVGSAKQLVFAGYQLAGRV